SPHRRGTGRAPRHGGGGGALRGCTAAARPAPGPSPTPAPLRPSLRLQPVAAARVRGRQRGCYSQRRASAARRLLATETPSRSLLSPRPPAALPAGGREARSVDEALGPTAGAGGDPSER